MGPLEQIKDPLISHIPLRTRQKDNRKEKSAALRKKWTRRIIEILLLYKLSTIFKTLKKVTKTSRKQRGLTQSP